MKTDSLSCWKDADINIVNPLTITQTIAIAREWITPLRHQGTRMYYWSEWNPHVQVWAASIPRPYKTAQYDRKERLCEIALMLALRSRGMTFSDASATVGTEYRAQYAYERKGISAHNIIKQAWPTLLNWASDKV